MSIKKKRIAIITNIIPPYREGFYDVVFNCDFCNVELFCQEKIAGSNIKSSHFKYGNKVHILKSYSPFNNESLVIQFLPIFKLWKDFDILIVDGNLRHFTLAIFSSFSRLFGKKIIIWSNVYTFGGSQNKQVLRLKWWKIFDNFLMYTEKDVLELLKLGFNTKNILSINNGLNQNTIDKVISQWDEKSLCDFKAENNINTENIIISSGRINTVNDHFLVLEAIKIIKLLIPDILWLVIGSGSELKKMRQLTNDFKLNNNVLFLDEIYDEEKKCPWFLISKGFIHPGPIGLSLFNAFGYSLPVITHDFAKYHGPEFSLFEDGKTGYLFHYKNVNDLALKINILLEENNNVLLIKKHVYRIVSNENNTDIMASRFFKMIKSIN